MFIVSGLLLLPRAVVMLPGRAAAVSLNPLCDVWSYRYCSYISYLIVLSFI